MSCLGNLIWILIGGIFTSLYWLFSGVLLSITIIGIPLGVQCFKAAKLTIANLLWMILAGWELAVGYFFASLICCITVVGIPFGLQGFKLMTLAFCPFGAEVK